MDEKIKVSIVGGSGYTGIELLRILSLHPNVDIHHITSRNDAGSYVYEVYPSLRGVLNHKFISPDEVDLKESNLVFFATPNGVAMKYAKDLIDNGVKVIDLSADFRIKDVREWEKWYEMPHVCPDTLEKAVYGLPEVNRGQIKNAQLVANPGCYPTAIQLALMPLLIKGLIDPLSIIADSKSGISGAGKKTQTGFLMSEASENFKAYSLTGHRHQPEIEENLSQNSPVGKAKVLFVPHLLPIVRGIHATIYVNCIKDFDPATIFSKFYDKEPFVDVMEVNSCPETKSVRASNICRVSFYKVPDTKQLVVLSVIDNLVKGAAGQAVQNMNIMMHWEETLGLKLIPLAP
jgi:N-acetyl-gamma-glutamyl-phosphate reductase